MKNVLRLGFAASCFVGGVYLMATGALEIRRLKK